jgi:hypothetical protein
MINADANSAALAEDKLQQLYTALKVPGQAEALVRVEDLWRADRLFDYMGVSVASAYLQMSEALSSLDVDNISGAIAVLRRGVAELKNAHEDKIE